MNTKSDKTSDVSSTPAAAEEPRAVYEVLVNGPTKVGGVLAYQGARLNLTKAQAEALNAAQPGTVKFLGI
jgi:hypothetical protein